MVEFKISPEEALEKLKEGNKLYIDSKQNIGDTSPEIREKTLTGGQHPYAIIVTCSDSRVIPESIFSAGIGDLFVIRVAGNVIDDHQLGSIEYAAGHLGTGLVVILGHTCCGAVGAALSHSSEGYIKSITDEIGKAVGDEKDEYKACCLNAQNSQKIVEQSLKMQNGFKVVSAIYHLENGKVEFI